MGGQGNCRRHRSGNVRRRLVDTMHESPGTLIKTTCLEQVHRTERLTPGKSPALWGIQQWFLFPAGNTVVYNDCVTWWCSEPHPSPCRRSCCRQNAENPAWTDICITNRPRVGYREDGGRRGGTANRSWMKWRMSGKKEEKEKGGKIWQKKEGRERWALFFL